jgi:hypothetical protein
MHMSIPFLACMASIAAEYHLPQRVLPSIQAGGGDRPGLVHGNTDGSQDLGIMQVNTRWVQPLAWQTGVAPTVAERRLLLNDSFSIAVAGAIMRIYLNEPRGNLQLAVGHYNSHTPVLAQAYQLHVLHAATRLFGAGSPR